MPKLPKTPAFWQTRNLKSYALWPLSLLYKGMLRIDQHEQSVQTVPLPVWCVGNVTVGGAGKTPIVRWLADWLQENGHAVHIISRGYGGDLSADLPVRVEPEHTAEDVGDEALLLAQHATTWIGRNRVAAAHAAHELGATMVLMDDGMQHWRINKDVTLLVMDGRLGVGNGFCLPAGPLREPLNEALERTSAVIFAGQTTQLPAHSAPNFSGRVVPLEPELLAHKTYLPFAGIGHPKKFFDTLSAHGATLVLPTAFPDHHEYEENDIAPLLEAAQTANATLVTTEKDAVRLPEKYRGVVDVLKVVWQWDDLEAVERWLHSKLTHSSPE